MRAGERARAAPAESSGEEGPIKMLTALNGLPDQIGAFQRVPPWRIANSAITRTAIERQRLSLSSDRITLIGATFLQERTGARRASTTVIATAGCHLLPPSSVQNARAENRYI